MDTTTYRNGKAMIHNIINFFGIADPYVEVLVMNRSVGWTRMSVMQNYVNKLISYEDLMCALLPDCPQNYKWSKTSYEIKARNN